MADGGPDSTFGTAGKVQDVFRRDSQANAVAIQRDGKIVVAGYCASEFAIVRYNPDGSIDSGD
jgi:beta-propeller uncharacterized protein DUF5122